MNHDLNKLVTVRVWTFEDGTERAEFRAAFDTDFIATVSPCRATRGDAGITISLETEYHASDLADELRRHGIKCRRDGERVRIPSDFVRALCAA